MYGLHIKSLCRPTAVVNAISGNFTAHSDSPQVLVNTQTSLDLYGTSLGEFLLENRFAVHDSILSVAKIPCSFQSPDAVLIFTSDHLATVSVWDGKSVTPRAEAALDVNPGTSGPVVDRVDHIVVSEGLVLGSEEGRSVVFGAQLFYGWLHVLRVNYRDGEWNVSVDVHPTDKLLCSEPDQEQALEGGVAQIFDISFFNMKENGKPLVGVLSKFEALHESTVNINCIMLDAQPCSTLAMRNVHPTTRLLVPVRHSDLPDNLMGSECGGMMSISSFDAFLLKRAPGALGEWKIEHLMTFNFVGMPVCIENIGPSKWVVGDSVGGLHLLSFQHGGACVSIATNSPYSIASTLCYVACRNEDAQGLLFVGSACSNSQLLAVPLLDKYNGVGKMPHEIVFHAVSPGLIDNPGPIRDAVAVEGLPGCSERHLVLCCGRFPCGSLRRAYWGAGVQSVIADGPTLQDGARLLTLKGDVGNGSDSFLCFSYDALGRTDALSIADAHFKHAAIPGFNHNCSTLAVERVSDDAIVQVTSQEVKLIHGGGEGGVGETTWSAQGSISHCVVSGNAICAAVGSTLITLQIRSRKLLQGGSTTMSQQVSALSFLKNSTNEYLLVGQWVTNTIQVLECNSLRECCQLELNGYQPRSFACFLVRPCSWCVLIGTNKGEVVMVELCGDSERFVFDTANAKTVEIGTTGVELDEVKGGELGDYVIAHCDQAAVFRLKEGHPDVACSNAFGNVEVMRLYLGKACKSLVPIHSAAIPNGLAWVSLQNQLMFGTLDLQFKMHWTTAMIGDTPTHAAYCAGSRALVVLTEGQEGQNCLRLVDACTLQPIASMALDKAHKHCGVAVANLPSSSAMEKESIGRWKDRGPSHFKEFVLVWSFVVVRETDDVHSENCQGLLSFLEVVSKRTGEGGGVEFEMKLHGSYALPSVPHSCTVVSPSDDFLGEWVDDPFENLRSEDQWGGAIGISRRGSTAGFVEITWGSNWPVVLVGCHDGVKAYKFFVDDDDVLPTQTVQAILAAMGASEVGIGEKGADAGEPKGGDDFDEDVMDDDGLTAETGEPDEDGDDLVESAKKQLAKDWKQSVVARMVGSAQAYGRSPVVSLRAMGNLVVASEFLGSLTVFRGDFTLKMDGQRLPLWAPLIPLSADRSAVCVQAIVPLSNSMILAALHPCGFVVVHQDLDVVEEQVKKWRAEIMRNFEAGGGPPGGQGGDQDAPSVYVLQTTQQITSLMRGASFALPQTVSGFCEGGLGLKPRPYIRTPGASSSALRDSHESSKLDHACVVFYTAGGMIGTCQTIPVELAKEFQKLQQFVSSEERKGEVGQCATAHSRGSTLRDLHGFEFNEAGICTDGDFLESCFELIKGGDVDVVGLAALRSQLQALNNLVYR